MYQKYIPGGFKLYAHLGHEKVAVGQFKQELLKRLLQSVKCFSARWYSLTDHMISIFQLLLVAPSNAETFNYLILTFSGPRQPSVQCQIRARLHFAEALTSQKRRSANWD